MGAAVGGGSPPALSCQIPFWQFPDAQELEWLPGPIERDDGGHQPTQSPSSAPGCCSLTPCARRLETANELGPFPASRSRVALAGVGHRSPRDGRDSVVWIGGNGR